MNNEQAQMFSNRITSAFVGTESIPFFTGHTLHFGTLKRLKEKASLEL